ncbi:MAG: adenosylcobinamide-GDP ribazoletransferase [Chloroflexota bacterium]|nr:adenosylcobinamide-GDP ribazoletransferase [Chloroflexota bacterium]
MGFWTAWQFLTIFPGPSNWGTDQEGIGNSVACFPLVGLVLGAALLGLDQLFNLFLPELLTSALLIVILVIFTGALHLDGFMDTCDGFAVKRSAAERLKVMSDSRVGGFGVAGACCLILLKYIALLSLPLGLRSAALLLTPTLSRWGSAYAMLAFPSARKEGLGQTFKHQTRWPMLLIATTITMALASVFLSYIGPVLMAATWLIVFLPARAFSSRLGGLTGDTYGAIIEISETCILIAMIIIDKAGGTSWLGSYL